MDGEFEMYAQGHGGLGVGLTGAHRTGKTTTAIAVAEGNGIPFLGSIGTDLAREMRIDFSKPIDFDTRLAYQEARIAMFDAAYKLQNSLFVADRTPLDLAAYLLADVPTDLSDQGVIERVDAYVQRCFDMTNTYFRHITFFQPALPYVDEPGKPPNNSAYQEKIHILALGLTVDRRNYRRVDFLPFDMLNLGQRVNFVSTKAQKAMSSYAAKIRNLPTC
mgnify:CR=1 FL=1